MRSVEPFSSLCKLSTALRLQQVKTTGTGMMLFIQSLNTYYDKGERSSEYAAMRTGDLFRRIDMPILISCYSSFGSLRKKTDIGYGFAMKMVSGVRQRDAGITRHLMMRIQLTITETDWMRQPLSWRRGSMEGSFITTDMWIRTGSF